MKKESIIDGIPEHMKPMAENVEAPVNPEMIGVPDDVQRALAEAASRQAKIDIENEQNAPGVIDSVPGAERSVEYYQLPVDTASDTNGLAAVQARLGGPEKAE